MKQIEATPKKPFYSVSYQYESNPYTNWSCHRFDDTPMKIGGNYKTMSGTDDKALAIKTANNCLLSSGIKFVYVHVTTDCYNHKEVYRAEINGDKVKITGYD